MRAIWKRRAALPVLCYACAVLLWLASCLFGLCADSAARAAGRLYTKQMTAAEWEPINAAWQPDGTLLTLTDDPQLIWRNTEGLTLRSLRVTAQYSASPREMCLYYTGAEGEDFGQDKRVFAAIEADGSTYVYTLPAGQIAALRLDPCSAADLTMTVQAMTLNEQGSAADYFVPGWYGVFCLLLYPALAAAALDLVWQWRNGRKKPECFG